MTDSELLDLAPDSLKSLSLKWTRTPLDPAVLGRMTGLTQLRLNDRSLDTQKDCSPMRRLRLQELALIDCPKLLSAVLGSGACKDLRKLHYDNYHKPREQLMEGVSEPQFTSDESDGDNYETELEESEAMRLGSLLQNMPHLKELSGRARFFREGMFDFLKGWHKSLLYCPELAALSRDTKPIIPVWRKP